MSSLLDRTRTLGTSGLSSPAILKRGRSFTTDNFMTFDDRWATTIDSTGAFLIGELERLDQTLHDPLIAVTWARVRDRIGGHEKRRAGRSFAAGEGLTCLHHRWGMVTAGEPRLRREPPALL